jgi:hypothetical protein
MDAMGKDLLAKERVAMQIRRGLICEPEQNSFPLEETKHEASLIPVFSLRPRASTRLRKQTVGSLKVARRVFSEENDQSELEKDLNRAADFQSTLLPNRALRLISWETYYDYAPALRVGGELLRSGHG